MAESGMSINYTQEKLWQATLSLATGVGPIRERLNAAALYLIRLHHVRPEERAFTQDAELQERFDALMDTLTSTPARGSEGNLFASICVLSDESACRIASEIFELFCEATDRADIPTG
jgi:hypothetical protein